MTLKMYFTGGRNLWGNANQQYNRLEQIALNSGTIHITYHDGACFTFDKATTLVSIVVNMRIAGTGNCEFFLSKENVDIASSEINFPATTGITEAFIDEVDATLDESEGLHMSSRRTSGAGNYDGHIGCKVLY